MKGKKETVKLVNLQPNSVMIAGRWHESGSIVDFPKDEAEIRLQREGHIWGVHKPNDTKKKGGE